MKTLNLEQKIALIAEIRKLTYIMWKMANGRTDSSNVETTKNDITVLYKMQEALTKELNNGSK